jgi:hypothetical protein
MTPALPTERIAHLGTLDCCIHPPGRNEMIAVTPPIIFSKEVDQNRPPHFLARTSLSTRNRFTPNFQGRGLDENLKPKSPPYRGSSAPQQPFGRTNCVGGLPLFIAPPLAGSLLAPLRCAGPCQSRSRATWPPSRYPDLSQPAFAPSVRSRCLSGPAELHALSHGARCAQSFLYAVALGLHLGLHGGGSRRAPCDHRTK